MNPGEVVYLRVKAWVASADSFEFAACHELLHGASGVFAYAPPAVVLQPSDTYMDNFQGFEIGVPLTPCRFLVPSHNPSTAENAPVELSYIGISPEYMFSSYLQSASEANHREGKKLGEVVLNGGVISYTPAGNCYGEEKFWGVFCCDFLVAFTTVTVDPLLKRPCLTLTPGDTIIQQRLVLRGLAPKRYRVEQSDNLTAWEPVGEFTANYSEVPVQDLSPLSATARFYRAVEVSP